MKNYMDGGEAILEAFRKLKIVKLRCAIYSANR